MAEDVTSKVEKFFAQYRLRNYEKGHILIFNGDDAEHIYYLVKGNVKQYDITYRGDEVILNVYKPPAFFPMSLAINEGSNPYIYEADTDIELRQAPIEETVAFIKTNPEVMFDLLSRVYRGLDGLLGRMARLMASSAKDRLIYELVMEARRFGSVQEDGSCLLSIHEKDLGARAGLSRETISREIHKMKADNLIVIRAKDILIKNLEALEKKLEKGI